MTTTSTHAGTHPVPHPTAGTRQLGHTSMEQEVRIDALPVTGEFPSWLTGSFMRCTPAKLDVGDRSVGHWFDGLGMLNVFSFAGGTVSYANRFFQTRAHEQAKRGRYDQAISIMTDPCRNFGQRMAALFDPSLVAEPHVNVGRLGKRFIAATEVPCPLEFDPDTLDTRFTAPIRDSLREFHGTYSHPQFDATPDQIIACVTRVGLRNEHRIVALDENLERTYLGGAPAARTPEYMHSFSMTENYFVLPLQPMGYSLPGILRTGRYLDGFRWTPENGTRFVVIDRRTGKVHSEHRTEAFFFWHTVNAFERDGEIVLDVVASDTPQQVWDIEMAKLRNPDHRPVFYGRLRRYHLLPGGGLRHEQLSDTRMEFPRINDSRNTLHYRYVYATAYRDGASDWFDQILKLNVETGEAHQWSQDGCYPSEPVFAAAPGATGEDDGVIMNVVLDSRAGRSFMLVLDARDLTEIARAGLPHHLPFNFHQQYFS